MTQSKNALAVVSVPFHGDSIEAAKTGDGKILVSLKRVCDSLGVNYEAQRQKLAECEWATTVLIKAVAQDGRLRQVTTIDHESLPMWLVTIHPSKVKPAAREKLLRFQREAKAVLSAWFLGTSAEAPGLAAEFAEVKRRLSSLEAQHQYTKANLGVSEFKNEILEGANEEKLAMLNAVLKPMSHRRECEYMTIRDYCDTYGVIGQDSGKRLDAGEIRAAGMAVSSMSAALGFPVRRVLGLVGQVNAYRIDVLLAWKVSFDLRTKMETDKYIKFFGSKK